MSKKITRYVSLSPFKCVIGEFQDKTNSVFGESVTDDSFYVPEKELIRRLQNGVAYGSALKGSFDFSDGKDTGMPIPIDRHKGIDLAEVTEFARTTAANAVDNLKADNKAAAEKAAAEKAAAAADAAANAAVSGDTGTK